MNLSQMQKDMVIAVEPPVKSYKRKKKPVPRHREFFTYRQLTLDKELVREWEGIELFDHGARLANGEIASYPGINKVCTGVRQTFMGFRWERYKK